MVRLNLTAAKPNSFYLGLAVVFFILSGLSLFLLLSLVRPPVGQEALPPPPEEQGPPPAAKEAAEPAEDIPAPEEAENYEAPPEETQPEEIQPEETQPEEIPAESQPTTPPPPPSSVNGYRVYQSNTDSFAITYKDNRTVYPDQESSGNRYTFYRPDSSFAVHAGSSWSWTHSKRQFTSDLLVSDHPTFRYDTEDQTIIDLENGGKKYTLQCIHKGLDNLKAECDHFIKSFKLI